MPVIVVIRTIRGQFQAYKISQADLESTGKISGSFPGGPCEVEKDSPVHIEVYPYCRIVAVPVLSPVAVCLGVRWRTVANRPFGPRGWNVCGPFPRRGFVGRFQHHAAGNQEEKKRAEESN